jgi:cob(I)alamin adenosyltransferase
VATRIYTKTGDKGDTGLFGGGRVQKDDVRVEAYGAVDELNAALGLGRALGTPKDIDASLERIQSLLFELGGDLATPPGKANRPAAIGDPDVRWLEQTIDAAEAELQPLKTFVLPGGSTAAGALHLARTVCRRAERRVVTLRTVEPDTTPLAVIFLNRLADLLFVLARLANHRAGQPDVPWRPRTGP